MLLKVTSRIVFSVVDCCLAARIADVVHKAPTGSRQGPSYTWSPFLRSATTFKLTNWIKNPP
jgi:hypothetical protein